MEITHPSTGNVRVKKPVAYTAKEWGNREIGIPNPLLGHVFLKGSRAMLAAESGLGKTMMAMAWAYAMALGKDFLHWKSHRPAKVLCIDGELPRDLLKERINTAYRSFGIDPDDPNRPNGPYFLSHEDVLMPPLDTNEGQQWVDEKLRDEKFRDLDFIIFDNLQALCSGNMKDEESWLKLKSWSRKLAARHIGQLWIHHTPRNKNHAYGTVTREWGMETCMLATASGPQDEGPSISLTFTKASRRKPDNAADFAPIILRLTDGRWSRDEVEQTEVARLKCTAVIALKALDTCSAELGHNVPWSNWRERMIEDGICKSDNRDSQATACRRARDELVQDGRVVRNEDDTFSFPEAVIPFSGTDDSEGDGQTLQ